MKNYVHRVLIFHEINVPIYLMGHPSAEIKKKIAEAAKSGNSITHLSNLFGYHRNSIRQWIKKEKTNPTFLRQKKPGSGRPSAFSGNFGKRLISIIARPASKFGFETDFWTTGRIQRICRDELKLKVSRMSIHRTMIKFEQSYKKPQKRYFEASKDKQTKWVKNDLQEIKKLIKTKKAILYFEDESTIQLPPVIAKTWGPIGKKIIQKVTGNRGSVSAISAVSSSGHLIFNIHKAGKRFSSNDIINFLTNMLKHHPGRHLVVVMDQAPCHRSNKVKKFIAEQKRLHVFYLPPRSPEFNPDEKIWKHLKHHELKSHTAKNTKELLRLARSKLRSLAQDRQKVRGIFKLCEMAHLYL